LFPAAINIVDQTRPRAVMLENVRGMLDAVFEDYRTYIRGTLKKLGYVTDWRLLNASDFGVPQLRPRVVFIAVRTQHADAFTWPESSPHPPATLGEGMCCNFVVEPKVGVNDRKFSSSQRTDRE